MQISESKVERTPLQLETSVLKRGLGGGPPRRWASGRRGDYLKNVQEIGMGIRRCLGGRLGGLGTGQSGLRGGSVKIFRLTTPRW